MSRFIMSKTNNTGFKGVQLNVRKNALGGYCNNYLAFYTDFRGKKHYKFFSISELGKRRAFNQAKLFRLKGEQQKLLDRLKAVNVEIETLNRREK